jgi:hypothetical protein
VDTADIEATILRLLAERGEGKTIASACRGRIEGSNRYGCAGLMPSNCPTAAARAFCSSMAAANSAGVPGLMT